MDLLEAHPDIKTLDTVYELTPNLDGGDVRGGAQIEQYHLDPDSSSLSNDGENGSSSDSGDIPIALIGFGAPDNEHIGFLDKDPEDSSSDPRFMGFYDCTSPPCQSVSNFPPAAEKAHPTEMASILIGDLTDDQDPNYSSDSAQIARSGYATEARVYVLNVDRDSTDYGAAFDKAVALSPQPLVISMSTGLESSLYDDCDGDTTLEEGASDVYADGSLIFFAAGTRSNYGSSSDCKVEAPGAARGVFTVGAHGGTSTSHVRNGAFANTPWGGNHSEGQDRSIIDLTAPRCRNRLYIEDGGYTSYHGCGSSNAAPTVAATAADFLDFYHNVGWGGTDIDEPGRLFVNTLLFGDGATRNGGPNCSSNCYRTTRFDHRTGAGRLRARKYTSAKMDAPWGYYNGSHCVDDGQTVVLPVNDGDPMYDEDVLKAAIWWYNPNRQYVPDVDLAVTNSSTDAVLLSSFDSSDNKERVIYDIDSGTGLNLEIRGYDVGSDTVCGTNSVRVHWAYFYEDSDRDDANGPQGSEIYTEL